jgi:hypothetical protein
MTVWSKFQHDLTPLEAHVTDNDLQKLREKLKFPSAPSLDLLKSGYRLYRSLTSFQTGSDLHTSQTLSSPRCEQNPSSRLSRS